jgi:DnaJ-class molecular chaperone
MVRVMVIPGVWEEAKECQECQGQGEALVEVAVVDYMRGGYLGEELGQCPECEGSGYTRRNDD